MSPDLTWPQAEAIKARRVALEPLRVDHAVEVANALGDPALHDFIGGSPPSADELLSRFARQVVGQSADGSQGWLNWVVRAEASGEVVGTVQATLSRGRHGVHAEVAWVIATPWQGRGLAKEAASAMVAWLRTVGVDHVMAHVHPQHAASAAVARHIGLEPTDAFVEDERRWASRGWSS